MRLFMSHDQKNLELADKIITYLDLKDEDGLYSLFLEQANPMNPNWKYFR